MSGKTKATAEAAALQAVEDYLKTEAFVNAIQTAVERAIDKHLTTLIHRVDQLEEANTGIKERLDDNDGKILELETSLAARKTEIKRLNDLVDAQATSINNLELTMNEADQYSRRNCLKFYGVKESDSENTDELICQLATNRLGIPLIIADLDRTHRVASRKNGTTDSQAQGANSKSRKPRAIIAKFFSYRLRSAVIRARRKLKGTGIGVDEALTSTNHELLWAAKKHEKVKEAWSSDGRIIALLPATGGKSIKRTIRSKTDLENI